MSRLVSPLLNLQPIPTEMHLSAHSVDEGPLSTPIVSDGGSTIGAGEITGIVLGSVGFLLLLAAAFSAYFRSRQSKVIDSDSEDIEQQSGAADAPKSFDETQFEDVHTTDDDEMVSDSPHRSRSQSLSSSTYSSSSHSSHHSSHANAAGVSDVSVDVSDDETPSSPSRLPSPTRQSFPTPTLSVVTRDHVSPLPSPRQIRHVPSDSGIPPVSGSALSSSSCGSLSSSSATTSVFSSSFASPFAPSTMQSNLYFSHSINSAISPSTPNTLTIHEAKFDQDFDDAEQDELERERQLRSLFQSLRIDDWHMRSFLAHGIGVNELTRLTPAELAQYIPSLRPRRFLLQYINERNGVATAAAPNTDLAPARNSVAFDTGRNRPPNSSPTASSVTFTPWSHLISTQAAPHRRTRAASITLAPVTTSVSVTDGADALASQSGTHTPISTGSGSEAITHVSRSTFELNSPTMFSTSSRTNYAQLGEYPDSQLVRTVSVSISHRPSAQDWQQRPSQAIPSNSTNNSQVRASSSRPASRPLSAHQSVTAAGRSQRDFEPSVIHASQVFSMLSQHHYYDQHEESQFEYSTNDSQHRTAQEEEEKDG